jgi:hypothetical protein
MSPSKFVVEVTTNDIKLGIQNESDACPVALAIKRKTGLLSRVYVSLMGADVGSTLYKLDGQTTVFIKKFDKGDPVLPFTAILTRVN